MNNLTWGKLVKMIVGTLSLAGIAMLFIEELESMGACFIFLGILVGAILLVEFLAANWNKTIK